MCSREGPGGLWHRVDSMVDSVRLYLRYVSISIRGQMEYRASFVMMALGQFAFASTEFLCIWALFDRFRNLRGWTLAEAALLYGIVNVAFSISEAVTRGFDTFGSMVRSGDFDRLLLRPRGTVLQLMGQELQLMRVGRFAQGLAVLAWAAGAVDLSWTPARAGLMVASIAGGACMFGGLFVLQATVAFWTIESLEIVNTVTYGGVETAQYPLSIYSSWFRKLFTYVIPLAFVNYFPAVVILGKPDPFGAPIFLGWLAPAAGLAFLLVSLQVWKVGVSHYCSTGS